MLAEIAGLRAELNDLRAELDDLRRQVKGKTPQNSSLPPSTQHPHARPAPPPRKRKSTKRRGGQPGHAKHERPLVPSEDCDEVQELKPAECLCCGGKLTGRDPDPLRHQVWELPEIKPHVTEYRRHRLACPCCGETTCAELPAGVPQGQSGPRLTVLVALLMAYYRQSKRRTAEFLGARGSAVLPGADGEDATSGDGGPAAGIRRVGRSTADAGPTEHRRNGDQGTKQEGVAVDVRGPRLHRVCGPRYARGDGAGRSAHGGVRRRGDLRSSQNVLAHRPFAMVSGAFETRFSSADRRRRRSGQTARVRPPPCRRQAVRALGQLSRRHDHADGLHPPHGAGPPRGRTRAAARGQQR